MNFKLKLSVFTLMAALIPIIILGYLFYTNFNTLTKVSLEQNTIGVKNSAYEYINSLARDKASIASLRMDGIFQSISVMGQSAQNIIDNAGNLGQLNKIYDTGLFNNKIIPFKNSLTNPPSETVNILVPPYLAQKPQSMSLLRISSLMNITMPAVVQANPSITFMYFVGDEYNAITRAYPNINLANELNKAGVLNANFWRDFFPENLPHWKKFYTDKEFSAKVLEQTGSAITFNDIYEDKAGQGKVLTLFYPLWNRKTNAFAGAVAADVSLNNIVNTVLDVHVVKTGYAVLINSKGEVIAHPDKSDEDLKVETKVISRNGLEYSYQDLGSSSNESIQNIYHDIIQNEVGYHEITLGDGRAGIMAFASLNPMNDMQYRKDIWKILILVPEDEILATLIETQKVITAHNQATILKSLIAVSISIAFVIMASFILSTGITRGVSQLGAAARGIANKNYDIQVRVTSKDEIGDLGKAFNQMSREIKDYTTNLEDMVKDRTQKLEKAMSKINSLNEQLKVENKRMSAELDVAQQLQLMVLPSESEFGKIEGLDIAGLMEPADEVGGDYYDVFQVKKSTLIGIGDVTGHGLSSGVIMLMAQTAIKTAASMGNRDMKQLLSTVNSVLYDNIERIKADKTMTLSLIDYKDNEYTIVGQHESVLVCRSDGTLENIDTLDLGFFIGLEKSIDNMIKEFKITLYPGDTMILYTDGITEAVNMSEEEFGIEGLMESVKKHKDFSAKEMLDSIQRDILEHIGNAKIHDDISMIVIKQCANEVNMTKGDVDLFGTFTDIDGEDCKSLATLQANAQDLSSSWNRCGMTANFLSQFFSHFFPYKEKAVDMISRDDAESTMSYILNELIENTAKYSNLDKPAVEVKLCLLDPELIFEVSNYIQIGHVEKFKSLCREILDNDPQELYIKKIEANIDDDASESGLGYLTLINDYGVQLGFKFQAENSQIKTSIQAKLNYRGRV
ncbi:MAG: hypothetical protein B0D92_04780 [Spirochaeta sp. LUC14_002_19_P3]|nr:MAG: hypothetical protein B0D92_04780 [Spirochaeta sp. LUC14_002_19_P3]